LYLELKNGDTVCVDDETTTLLCDNDSRCGLWVFLWVRVVVEVVEGVFVVGLLL